MVVDVKLISLHVCHDISRIECFQPVYHVTLNNGKTMTRYGATHFIFRSSGGRTSQKRLNENEFIIRGIRVYKTGRSSGISFVTNQREINFGVIRCRKIVDFVDDRSSTEIIGFKTLYGDKNIGIFAARHLGWQLIGTYILMRRLIGSSRATVLQLDVGRGWSNDIDTKEQLAHVMKGLVNVDAGVFRNVMKFIA